MTDEPCPSCEAPSPRIRREKRTVGAMIDIFCRAKHGGSRAPCDECLELRAYAFQRLDRCPYGEDKPTCARCPIHCYRADMKDRVREVMRFAGPRMVYRHPILSIFHQVDALIRKVELRKKGRGPISVGTSRPRGKA